MTTAAVRERILIATAMVLLGVPIVAYTVPPILSQLGHSSNWLWLAYTFVLLVIPFGLLIPALVRPRSVVAAVLAALSVGVLIIVGIGLQPMTVPRYAIHLAAILSLAALVVRVIRGIGDRRFSVLWIVPGLIFGFAIGYAVARLTGLHIVSQFCNWPPLGGEISSYLCSG